MLRPPAAPVGPEARTTFQMIYNNLADSVSVSEVYVIPAGFDPDHPRANLLRHKGLYGHSPHIRPEMLQTPELIERCLKYAKILLPLHSWFMQLTQT